MDDLSNARHAAWVAINAAFGSLGRVFLTLDASFRVLHASEKLDALAGAGAAAKIAGQPVESLLGPELFGASGALRQALAAGERREGWRASLRVEPEGSRLVSVTAAPLSHDAEGICDPAAQYLVVLRPAEEGEGAAAAATTSFGGLIARSPAMEKVFRLVQNLEHSEATVLVTGESGTGKEMVARAIHAHSPRRDGPFVAVNCGAIPGELLESELFGHVRGAFTGAVKDRAGRFELASGGTLFLDEIGDLPLGLQVKLLRVLQERTFERVGESKPRQSDARIVSATNQDLRRAVQEGRFRDDLFYRLRVVPVELPPLRDRLEDVEPLARYLLARVGERTGRELRFSPDAMRALLAHDWPGNVRELENALEYASAVCKGQTLQPEDLPAELSSPRAPPGASEQQTLRAALEKHQWNRAETARALGMSRSTLWRKMRELGLSGR